MRRVFDVSCHARLSPLEGQNLEVPPGSCDQGGTQQCLPARRTRATPTLDLCRSLMRESTTQGGHSA
eukprot:8904146-Pyramimonas_sp.AAC.1